MRNRLITGTIAFGAAALMAGCTAHAQAGGYAEADAPVVFVDEPTLVFVEPGIWVVRDYDYAVYYVDGYYWVYRSNIWYRSHSYARGWTTVEVNVVPRLVVNRNHKTYVHYHGAANAQTRKAPQAPDDHDRSERADHGNGPPGQDKDKDHGNGPPGQDKDKDKDHGIGPSGNGPPGQDKDKDKDKKDDDKDKDKKDDDKKGDGRDKK